MGYTRTVSLFIENTTISQNRAYNYTPNTAFAILNKNTKMLHNQIHHNLTDLSVDKLGSETHNSDVILHKTYHSNILYGMSNLLSPEEFFHQNGKYPPYTLNTNAPDLLKPVTSITEVATIGLVSSFFPKTVINQSTQILNKRLPKNFSNQVKPDCYLEIKLNDGQLFKCFADSKTMNLNVLQRYLYNMANYKNGDKLECNFYFVGGLKKSHIFSLKEKNEILNLIYDRCNDLYKTNDSVARSFVNQNLPAISEFDRTGSLIDLQKNQIGPFLFGQETFGSWFSSLVKYP